MLSFGELNFLNLKIGIPLDKLDLRHKVNIISSISQIYLGSFSND
jgi:hypothetical protein